MQVIQQVLKTPGERPTAMERSADKDRLVLVFGPRERLCNAAEMTAIVSAFPGAKLVGCSTAGNITREGATDEALTLTTLTMDSTHLRTRRVAVEDPSRSREAGFALARLLETPDLRYLLVLSGGLHVNGSELVNGLRLGMGSDIPFTGGLAADGGRFQKTVMVDNDGAREGFVVGVGFYGHALRVQHVSIGGWQPLGEPHTVTRAKGNVVYEMDGKPALDMYASLLGEASKSLPTSALVYPLAFHLTGDDLGLNHTVVAIDREKRTLTFAGNIPHGGKVHLLRADPAQLVSSAKLATKMTLGKLAPPAEVALLVSGMGRKQLLQAQTPQEVQAVAEELPGTPVLTGFYAHGEFGRYEPTGRCELHNQTLTVTTLAEVDS